MVDQEVVTADEAMAFIEAQRAAGLTPVMAGTSFYRHSFSVSQFGSYVQYLDERGTAGRCQPKNLLRTFDFIDLGPVPGAPVDLQAPAGRGYGMVTAVVPGRRGYGMVAAVVPGERRLSLLEAAEAALRVMPAGPERDDLESAVAAERRMH